MPQSKGSSSPSTQATLSVGITPGDDPVTGCTVATPSDPCTLIIFGATGDLTSRKLMPALFELYTENLLPQPFTIVGCGRTPLSQGGFRDRMHKALADSKVYNQQWWRKFARLIHYHPLDYIDPGAFKALAATLDALDQRYHTHGNRLFYLALPPTLYLPVAQNIGAAGLGQEFQNGLGWSRLVVEKPFGRDLASAIALDQGLQAFFKERQIFRIDHYLAKETVQNLLMFRFANSIFEPVWDRRYVEHVNITATETLGVGHRAGYYEQSGVLRDMFQNHMMMLLALIAMEPPTRFEADAVRNERIKVFSCLRPLDTQSLDDHLVLGQYGPGGQGKNQMIAYRREPGVDPDSLTPTYAKMKIFLDNWRWQGVPFYLTSGKRLAQKITQIAIQFKQVPHSMFRSVLGGSITANRLIIGIHPEEKITLTFQTKTPGARVCLQTVTMDFTYQQHFSAPTFDAYTKVLVDAMLGDQTLFWHQEGVQRCWHFLTPVLDQCEQCQERPEQLNFYPAGSWGPEAVKRLGPRSLPLLMNA